jgi:hypothetical protein
MIVASLTPFLTGLIGLGGVALGGGLAWWKEAQTRRAQALSELHGAALHVLARTEKIQRAEELGREWAETRSKEIAYLGGDLDSYLAAIARVTSRTEVARRHCAIYDMAMPIVIGHETWRLPEVIAALIEVRNELFDEQEEEQPPSADATSNASGVR